MYVFLTSQATSVFVEKQLKQLYASRAVRMKVCFGICECFKELVQLKSCVKA